MIAPRTRTVRLVVLALAFAFAHAAPPQENLSFELVPLAMSSPGGWRLAERNTADAGRATVDTTVAHDGAHSLRIDRAAGGGLTRVMQRIPIDGRNGGNRIALSGYVRSSGADASLWLRVDGPGGFLAADSRGATDAAADANWTLHSVQLPLPEDAREVVLGLSVRGAGAAWFDTLAFERVDAATLPPPSGAALRYVSSALDIMQQHSINRRTIDWPILRAAALEHARGSVSHADAHLAVRFALRELGDHHSYLLPPPTAQALSMTPVSNARTGRQSEPPRAQLVDGVGLLVLPGFAGGTPIAQVAFANAVQDLIEDLDEAAARGFILDLRGNSGGNLWPMLAGVGPLLGAGEAGASVYPDGRETPYWYEEGKAGFGEYVQLRVSRTPYTLRRPSAPVAVLIDARTASSAEVLAIALRARPNTALLGARTRGLAAGNRTFELADGAALVLTVAATRDRAGRTYAAAIEPDVAVAQESPPSGKDAAVAAALEWVKARAAAD